MHGIFNIIYKDVTRRFCMYDAYSRMEILLGQKGVNRLSTAKIAVFGLGVQAPIQWKHWHDAGLQSYTCGS